MESPLSHIAGWSLVLGPALTLGLIVLALIVRRVQLRESAESHAQLRTARERGSQQARLQHPDVDLSQCIGCGACVRACPEEGVLGLLHGQAVVVHGARCVGHALCAAACPTGAIALTLGDLSERRDLPAIGSDFEAAGSPGLFIAGELSGFALVRTAVAQGVAAADAIARRVAAVHRPQFAGISAMPSIPGEPRAASDEFDLLIVGAGPAGLASALRARERGLNFIVIEQESRLGGSVAAYPRRKLVMTQALDLPLYGRLPHLTYRKEELIEIWEDVARKSALPIRAGVRLEDLGKGTDGVFEARTSAGMIRTRTVCLALGRRGSPRRLGVPGEDLPKVSYSLIDAESYQGRRILVVGGGDSAIEAALGLAEQPGNQVTLSYRRGAFTRLKARNQSRIDRAMMEGRVGALFESEVREITPQRVVLQVAGSAPHELPNDDVFIFAGGDPPFALLERAGVSFDPKDRPTPPVAPERNTGLLSALSLALVMAIALAVWALWFRAYYSAQAPVRTASRLHLLLRPAGPLGVSFGIGALGLMTWNLAYLVRRSMRWGSWLPGSLRAWMATHVFTGLACLMCVVVHAGFSMRPTVSGHALLALIAVVITGSVGRYLYAFVPRAANGTEASLDDLRAQLVSLSADWDRDGRGFGTLVHQQIDDLITNARWRPSFVARLCALLAGQVRLRRTIRRLRHSGAVDGVPLREVRRTLLLARQAYRLTLLVTHYDEIRMVLSSWRYFHRWLALLMVLLALLHVGTALRYASLKLPSLRPTEASS